VFSSKECTTKLIYLAPGVTLYQGGKQLVQGAEIENSAALVGFYGDDAFDLTIEAVYPAKWWHSAGYFAALLALLYGVIGIPGLFNCVLTLFCGLVLYGVSFTIKERNWKRIWRITGIVFVLSGLIFIYVWLCYVSPQKQTSLKPVAIHKQITK
jgi:hypothetical protein